MSTNEPQPTTAALKPDLKSTIAKEWLFFLALLPIGGFVCFVYYASNPNIYATPFDDFWNDGFGFHRIREHYSHGRYEAHEWFPVFLWVTPYLSLILLRSVWWSVRTLWPHRADNALVLTSVSSHHPGVVLFLILAGMALLLMLAMM